MSAYDHNCFSSDTVKNGFEKAGITSAVENGVELPEDFIAVESIDSDDPFNSDDDWNGDRDEH